MYPRTMEKINTLQSIAIIIVLYLSSSVYSAERDARSNPAPISKTPGIHIKVKNDLSSTNDTHEEPEYDMTTTELCKYWGYPNETYEAVTDDGYVLTLHRIPHGKTGARVVSETGNRGVVLLQHGLLDTSACWVLNKPWQSFGFMLADAGFDVWMGNCRGNMYTKKHKHIDPKSKHFWDFSINELVNHDIGALIKRTLQLTGEKKLFYVGYSQGTIMAFAGFGLNPHLQELVRINFALAPVTILANVQHTIRPAAVTLYGTFNFLRKMGYDEFLPHAGKSFVVTTLCKAVPKICQAGISMISGPDMKNLNKTRLPVYMAHLPAGTSVKNMLHYAQMVKSGKFQGYDYGAKNVEHYGEYDPPSYDVTKVKVPTVLVQGMEDWLATPKDVNWTASQLPNILKRIQLPHYNHIDFVWGMHAHKDVYQPLIDIMKKDLERNS